MRDERWSERCERREGMRRRRGDGTDDEMGGWGGNDIEKECHDGGIMSDEGDGVMWYGVMWCALKYHGVTSQGKR